MLLLLPSRVQFAVIDLFYPVNAPKQPWINTLGAIAVYLLIIVLVTSYYRFDLGRRRWKALHFTTYALFPAAPPWLASQEGALPPTARLVKLIWTHVPIAHFRLLFEKGERYSNAVAAIPSLHAAYALLIALVLWRSARRGPWRVLLAAYPVAMAFALVYSGEHYAIDILLGWLYAVLAFVVVERAADWLAARKEPEPEPLAAVH